MEFQILGPVRVSDGDRIVDLGSPKQRCVLASLLIRANHAVSLERLVDELWGDEPPDDPLAAIHAYVSRLRRALDPDRRPGGKDGILVRAPPGYRLQVDDDHIDARRFERLADEGRRAQEDGDSESAARLLESALALWRGDALSDLAGYSAARVEATRLEQIRLRAIEELFDALLVLGRHDSVASEAVTVLGDHPYLERVRGQLMLALYRCDRQVDALRTYREGREILMAQLGIDPSPALQQLEDDILLQKPHLDWRPTVQRSRSTRLTGGSFSTTRGPQRRSEFVGRDTELAVLVDSWHRAADGERQLVVVSGEPGIGKTRLASELATVARREGGTVLAGGAHLDSVVPYQPFAEALDSYAAAASPVELRDAIADDNAILAKLAPGLLGRIATPAAPIHADASTERFKLFDAAAKVLQRLAARGPLLVVLDDLQWADPGTWLLVVHLARLPVDVRLLLVATLRDPDTDVDHVAMLAGLRRDGAGEINLRGLDEHAVGGLIAARWGPARADEVRAVVAARSSGNPFYVEQLLANAEETSARTGADPEGVELAAFGVPQGVLDVIGQRVAALSAPARRVLAAASVVGQEFDLDLVGAITGFGTGELLDHLDEAVAARLIIERPGSIGRYRFAHALTRDALYGGFTETRRAHVHQQTGDALDALGRRDQLGELAHHLLLGRADPVRAATYACLAGHQALDQLAHEEAANLFERGLRALAGGDDGGDIRVDLLLGVVEARGRGGEVTAARQALADAASQARAIDDADRLARTAVATTRGYLTVLPEPDEVPVGLLEEALTRLDENDSELRAQVLARLAVGLYFAVADRRAVKASTAAVAMARRLGSDDALGHALVSHHLALQDPAHVADRLAVVAELRKVADRLGDVELMVCARYLPVADHLASADVAAADAAMADCEELLDQTQQPLLRLLPVQHRAMRAILAGDLGEGERLATSALELAGAAGYHYAQTFGSLIFELRWLQGRLGEIEGRLARYAEREPNFTGWAAALTMTHAEAGRLDEARPRWETIAANGFKDLRFDHTWTTVMLTNAEIAVALHDEPRAAILYRLLLPYHEQLVVLGSGVVCIGALARTLGQLASVTGQWDDAEAHFRTSDQLNRRVAAAPFVARSQIDHAAMLVSRRRRGDLARAQALLAQARYAAQQFGLRGLLPRIDHLVS